MLHDDGEVGDQRPEVVGPQTRVALQVVEKRLGIGKVIGVLKIISRTAVSYSCVEGNISKFSITHRPASPTTTSSTASSSSVCVCRSHTHPHHHQQSQS